MIDLDCYWAAINAGDADAFKHWLAGAELPIRYSLRRFAASVDTEAVIQESLLRVWQVAPRAALDGKPNALLRFAIRIAHNLAVSETRRLHTSDPEADAFDIEQQLSEWSQGGCAPDPFLRERVRDCLAKLPNKPFLAMQERLRCAEPDVVLADRVGMQLNTFLQNVTRARKFLLDCLEKAGVSLEVELR